MSEASQSSPGVLVWWALLSAVGVGNIVAWVRTARALQRGDAGEAEQPAARAQRGSAARSERRGVWGPSQGPHDDQHHLRVQLALSAVFVFVCAFRSFLPRAEGQRICMLDGWISSAALARSAATVAELSLVAQWTLVLRALARRHGAWATAAISWILLPLIAFAEVCSWYTTLTTNFVGSVIEESTWAVTGALLILGLGASWRRTRGSVRQFVQTAMAATAVYVIFMWTVDVPMYASRVRADERAGRTYLSLADGWRDANERRVVTRRWDDWQQEIPWMSLYFSAGVWISLILVRAPYLEREPSP